MRSLCAQLPSRQSSFPASAAQPHPSRRSQPAERMLLHSTNHYPPPRRDDASPPQTQAVCARHRRSGHAGVVFVRPRDCHTMAHHHNLHVSGATSVPAHRCTPARRAQWERRETAACFRGEGGVWRTSLPCFIGTRLLFHLFSSHFTRPHHPSTHSADEPLWTCHRRSRLALSSSGWPSSWQSSHSSCSR